MSSMSRSHHPVPAAGLGTGGWQEEEGWAALTPSVGACINFMLSLQPSCHEMFSSWLEGSILGWCLQHHPLLVQP